MLHIKEFCLWRHGVFGKCSDGVGIEVFLRLRRIIADEHTLIDPRFSQDSIHFVVELQFHQITAESQRKKKYYFLRLSVSAVRVS